MAHAHTTYEADCSSPARRYSGALLLLAIAGLLVACGDRPAPGGGAIVCATGAAPTVLTWNAVAGAAGYRIYYGTKSGTYPQIMDVGPTITYTVTTGLSSGTTYYFAATAYDLSVPPNESSFSNEVCKTIS
jgi:hypothetical protein